MRIHAVSQSIQTEFRKIETAKKTDKNQSTAKNAPVDHSEISSGGQRLSSVKASIETITTSISAQPDIRTEKITEIQEKIKNGFYNSPEFIDKLAEKLLAEFGISAPKQQNI